MALTRKDMDDFEAAIYALQSWSNGNSQHIQTMPNGVKLDSPAKIIADREPLKLAIAWPPGGTVYSAEQKYSYGGIDYAPKPLELPFTGVGDFPTDKMYVVAELVSSPGGNDQDVQVNYQNNLAGSGRLFYDYVNGFVGWGNSGFKTRGPKSELHVCFEDGGLSQTIPQVTDPAIDDITPIDGTLITLQRSGTAYLGIISKDYNEGGVYFGNPTNVKHGAITYRHTTGWRFKTKGPVAGNSTGMVLDENGRVGLGTLYPDASCKMEISSTTKGYLPPRMTTAQRDAIDVTDLGRVTGLEIFNLTTNQPEHHNGTIWTTT